MQTHSDSFLHESQLLHERDMLLKEKKLFSQEKAHFEEERKLFTDAAVKLGREVRLLCQWISHVGILVLNFYCCLYLNQIFVEHSYILYKCVCQSELMPEKKQENKFKVKLFEWIDIKFYKEIILIGFYFFCVCG